VLLPCKQEHLPIVAEVDIFGINVVPSINRDLSIDSATILFVAIRAAGEEEVMVALVRVLLEVLLQHPVGFIALLSLKCMGDLSLVDGGYEAIRNRTDHLIKVGLCGEDIECSL
jgi:hypothetical protein